MYNQEVHAATTRQFNIWPQPPSHLFKTNYNTALWYGATYNRGATCGPSYHGGRSNTRDDTTNVFLLNHGPAGGSTP